MLNYSALKAASPFLTLLVCVFAQLISSQQSGLQPGIFDSSSLTPFRGPYFRSNNAVATSKPRYPGCSNIDSIGSPILLLFQAQGLLTEGMKVQTTDTFVRFWYAKQQIIPTQFSVLYTLVFQITESAGSCYFGILLDNPSNGIGSTKFLKFILNPDLAKVKAVLKITEDFPTTPYVCGDLKMIFSSYGNDPRKRLPGDYPGLNFNGLSPAMLKALQDLVRNTNLGNANDPTDPNNRPQREHTTDHYINSDNYYYNGAAGMRPPVAEVISAFERYFEEIRCSPSNERIIESLTLGCRAPGAPNLGEGEIYTVSATFKVPFYNTLETTPTYGNTNPPLIPAGTTFVQTTIEFANVERMDLYYPDTGRYFALLTYNANGGLIGSYYCGSNGVTQVPLTTPRDSFSLREVVGLFGGKTSQLVTGNNPLTYFGFVRYK